MQNWSNLANNSLQYIACFLPVGHTVHIFLTMIVFTHLIVVRRWCIFFKLAKIRYLLTLYKGGDVGVSYHVTDPFIMHAYVSLHNRTKVYEFR